MAFSTKLLLLALPGLAVAAVNYTVDPSMVFHPDEPRIASMIASGQPVAGVLNFSDRDFNRLVIERRRPQPQVIALGSSRIREASSDLFPGRTFANHAISTSTIEDHIAVSGVYERLGHRPALVVLSVDPWALNGNSGIGRWRTWHGEYVRFARRIGLDEPPANPARAALQKPLQLISPSYFQSSIKSLAGREPSLTRARVVNGPLSEDEEVLRPDGSREISRNQRSRKPAQVRGFAIRYASRTVKGLQRFTRVDAGLAAKLEALVTYYTSRGSRVVLVLLPYHPESYKVLRGDSYRGVAAAESYVRALGAARGVSVLGSYDPSAAGCGPADFHDGLHPSEPCLRRVLASLR